MSSGTDLFEVVGSLSYTKQRLIFPDNEREYNPYMVNSAFSQHADTVLYAAEMNCRPWASKLMQHDFYLHGLMKRNRRGKWAKRDPVPDGVKSLARYLKCSVRKASELYPLLSEEDKLMIDRSEEKGGRTRGSA